jgi:hypothetical protein
MVLPGGTVAVDLTADAPGDWAFHCHMLYHMHAGMMRVVTVRPLDGGRGMKRLLILLAATALTAPALAQHGGHHPPGHTMPIPKAKPKAAPKPAARKAPQRRSLLVKRPRPKRYANLLPKRRVRARGQGSLLQGEASPSRQPIPTPATAHLQNGRGTLIPDITCQPARLRRRLLPQAPIPHAGHNHAASAPCFG